MATSFRQLKDIANAFVIEALSANRLPAALRDLQNVTEAFRHDRALATALMEPSVADETRQKALKKALHGQLDELTLNALLVLQEQNLLDELSAFSVTAISSAKEQARHRQAKVTTAIGLNAAERKSIEVSLQKKFGGTIELEEHIDSTLVGGLLIDVDGWRYDGTVTGNCRRLREALATS